MPQLWKEGDAAAATQAVLEFPEVGGGRRELAGLAYARLLPKSAASAVAHVRDGSLRFNPAFTQLANWPANEIIDRLGVTPASAVDLDGRTSVVIGNPRSTP